jgi:TetR/AcrR family transcriptional repressor of mexJK operon
LSSDNNSPGSIGGDQADARPATHSDKARGRPVDIAKRQAIVNAAAKAFFDVGYAASAIEQIAAEAGVSKVTIYNHFGDKRALFAAAVEHECSRLSGLFAIDSGSGGTIRERLTAIGEAMLAFLSRPEMVQFERRIAAETENEPELGMAFLKAGPWQMKRSFAAFLENASDRGELSIANPQLAAEQFVSMCKGMGDLERRFSSIPTSAEDQERISGAVDVFLTAYSQR